MLDIKKTKRLKKTRNKPKIIFRVVLTLAILAVVAAAGYGGYLFYKHINENPSISVEYKQVDQDKGSKRAMQYYPPVRLTVEHVSETIKPGDKTTFSFKTNPEISCKIGMKDKDKQAYEDPKFVSKKSDKKGFVSWEWEAKNVSDGDVMTVTATCSNPSHSKETSREIKINSKPKTEQNSKSNQPIRGSVGN